MNHFVAFNSHQTPSNLVSLTILSTLRFFAQFYTKIKAIKLQKEINICLT